MIHSLLTNHLKGVKWVVSLSREKRKRGIAAVPLLSGGLFVEVTRNIHHCEVGYNFLMAYTKGEELSLSIN